MPGLIVFNRRWSVASDDLVVPALSLLIIHLSWFAVLCIVLYVVEDRDWRVPCMTELYEHTIGYLVILIGCSVVEALMMRLSLKGTIMDTGSRDGMAQLLYVRTAIFFVEFVWLMIGVIWIIGKYDYCSQGLAKDTILAITISNWIVLSCVLVTVWCTFDSAGKSWLKMKRFNDSLRSDTSKFQYRRSGNSFRNWRHRKAVREYRASWDRRCKLLFCCVGSAGRKNNTLSEVAKILSEFFRDLDIVPSDIVAGLLLLRRMQQIQRSFSVKNQTNGIFQYLSGVKIDASTKFMDVTDPQEISLIEDLIHYLHYAMACYGWPLVLYAKNRSWVDLWPGLFVSQNCPMYNCLPTSFKNERNHQEILGDTHCHCNVSALEVFCRDHKFELIYANYCNKISEPNFFIVVDHEKRSIVISIRGTLSLADVLTDLNAAEGVLPLDPPREDWFAHRGIIDAAVNIKKQLFERGLLEQSFNHLHDKSCQTYDLVVVGHSLGAGTATILSVLLREHYPSIKCYAFSPPGGLLSEPLMTFTKDFVTSLVLGKDVVTRLGLHQMEELRSDLLYTINQCNKSKWKIISESANCFTTCFTRNKKSASERRKEEGEEISRWLKSREKIRPSNSFLHPGIEDENYSLTVHERLYPPGNIIHIVRNHPSNQLTINGLSEKSDEKRNPGNLKGDDVVYQALYVDNHDFDEILISPTMFQDHLPDHVLDSLEQLLLKMGPPKPERMATLTNSLSNTYNSYSVPTYCSIGSLIRTPTPDSLDTNNLGSCNRVLLETSFTDLRESTEQDAAVSHRSNINSIRPSLLSALKYHRKTDVLRDHQNKPRPSTAPLASPETLSETSSIHSRRSSMSQFCPETRLNLDAFPSRLSGQHRDTGNSLEESHEKNGKNIYTMNSCHPEKDSSCDLESFARSEVSLQELIDVFASAKTSPSASSSSLKDATKHVTFDPPLQPNDKDNQVTEIYSLPTK